MIHLGMPRLQLFELEDLPWFPAGIRDLGTDYIHFVERRLGLHRPMLPLLRDALRDSATDRVVDLCSGGGGPVQALARDLAAAGVGVRFTLTDRFPNLGAFRAAAAAGGGAIDFVADPVDARAVPPGLSGLRTVCNAFHHFAPADATAILQAASEAGQPIAVFEIPDRRWRALLPFLFTPLYLWLLTPFLRPFRWRRLLWTYLVPVVPLYCWWDGIVSTFRAYRADELLRMAGTVGGNHRWRAGTTPLGRLPGRVTWLIGVPARP